MKWKICGNRENIAEVAALKPDFMGFIYWEPSSRALQKSLVDQVIPKSIQKVGVFVDAPPEEIKAIVQRDQLDMLQLHGQESPIYVERLKEELGLPLIKAIAVGPEFDFRQLRGYREHIDFFLFDTKGKLPGGNGLRFDWSVLTRYKESIPYFLSGGIGPDAVDSVLEFLNHPEVQNCAGLDVNSKFENSPGEKNTANLQNFINAIEKRI